MFKKINILKEPITLTQKIIYTGGSFYFLIPSEVCRALNIDDDNNILEIEIKKVMKLEDKK